MHCKHHAQQFNLAAIEPAPLELRAETATVAAWQPPPDTTPALFAVPPTFKPTKMDHYNRNTKNLCLTT